MSAKIPRAAAQRRRVFEYPSAGHAMSARSPAELARILDAMERYGGSFIQGLAMLYRRADPANRARLECAFADYFHRYDEMAKLPKRPHAGAIGGCSDTERSYGID